MTGRLTSTSDVTGLLADLVAIPSVNPMGRDGGPYGEEALARFLEAWLGRHFPVDDVAARLRQLDGAYQAAGSSMPWPDWCARGLVRSAT